MRKSVDKASPSSSSTSQVETHLKTSTSRVALLLLGALSSARLAAGALSARRLSLSTRHCRYDRVKKSRKIKVSKIWR
jgi:hypothetical protein